MTQEAKADVIQKAAETLRQDYEHGTVEFAVLGVIATLPAGSQALFFDAIEHAQGKAR